MAISASINVVDERNLRTKLVDLKLDGSYATGGYALSPSTLGLREILSVTLCGGTAPAGIVGHYNHGTGKLQLFGSAATNQAALSELAANSAVVSAATVVRLLVIGI